MDSYDSTASTDPSVDQADNEEARASAPTDATSTIVTTPTDNNTSSPNPHPEDDSGAEDVLSPLKEYNGFIGHPALKTEVIKWKPIPDGKGRILHDTRINKPLILVGVFQIMTYKFYVAPMGNYNGTYSLNSARYRFVGGPPMTEPYSTLFKQTLQLLKHYEKKASDHPSSHLFENEGKGIPGINFSYPVFCLRDKALPNREVRYLEDDAENLVNEEDPDSPLKLSAYGLSQSQYKAYSQIVAKYHMQPLPVYKNGKFVQPPEVEDVLRRTVALVQFNLINHFIEKDRTQSIIARVEDVSILHSAPQSPLKRRNVLDGPLTPEKQGSPSKKSRG